MTPTLAQLIALLARGSAVDGPTFTGLLEEHDGGQLRRCWRVWRRGRLARVEDPPGTMTLIAGQRTYWRRWPVDPAVVAIPRDPDHDEFELSVLTLLEPERHWHGWLGRDPALVGGTLAPTTYDGRAAWSFTAPETTGARSLLTVDAELGLVLRAERPHETLVRSWREIRTDLGADAGLFHHGGPWQRSRHWHYPDGWVPE